MTNLVEHPAGSSPARARGGWNIQFEAGGGVIVIRPNGNVLPTPSLRPGAIVTKSGAATGKRARSRPHHVPPPLLRRPARPAGDRLRSPRHRAPGGRRLNRIAPAQVTYTCAPGRCGPELRVVRGVRRGELRSRRAAGRRGGPCGSRYLAPGAHRPKAFTCVRTCEVGPAQGTHPPAGQLALRRTRPAWRAPAIAIRRPSRRCIVAHRASPTPSRAPSKPFRSGNGWRIVLRHRAHLSRDELALRVAVLAAARRRQHCTPRLPPSRRRARRRSRHSRGRARCSLTIFRRAVDELVAERAGARTGSRARPRSSRRLEAAQPRSSSALRRGRAGEATDHLVVAVLTAPWNRRSPAPTTPQPVATPGRTPISTASSSADAYPTDGAPPRSAAEQHPRGSPRRRGRVPPLEAWKCTNPLQYTSDGGSTWRTITTPTGIRRAFRPPGRIRTPRALPSRAAAHGSSNAGRRRRVAHGHCCVWRRQVHALRVLRFPFGRRGLRPARHHLPLDAQHGWIVTIADLVKQPRPSDPQPLPDERRRPHVWSNPSA